MRFASSIAPSARTIRERRAGRRRAHPDAERARPAETAELAVDRRVRSTGDVAVQGVPRRAVVRAPTGGRFALAAGIPDTLAVQERVPPRVPETRPAGGGSPTAEVEISERLARLDAELDKELGRSEILVVEDDPRNVMAIEAALGGIGAELVVAKSADAALRLVLDRDFCVVLLDLRLPDAEGFEVAELIRGRLSSRHLPIIFLTAFGHSPDEVRRGYELGAVDYIIKPFAPEELRSKVRVFVELRHRAMQLRVRDAQLRRLEIETAARRMEEARLEWEAAALWKEIQRERGEKARLEEADRRKDEFLAVLAHELRNPLTPLVTGVELVRAGTQGNETVAAACDAMARQLSHLVRLVDDLLDVSRISQGKVALKREPMDVRACVQHAVEMCRPTLDRAGHHLHVAAGDDPLVCNADRVRITQVVSNLLANAIRYTPPNGNVWISAAREGEHVVIRVRDDGIGIEPAMLDRVFETFVQEQAGGGGLGLGLTLVKQVAELHGGRVRARSDGKGKGSELEVELPLASAVADHGDASVATPSKTDAAALRVLVIEDNEDIRVLTQMMLESWGHAVETAGTGAEGIEAALARRPDAVLLDVGLPDTDGYVVARTIREALGEACPRLVAVTGFGQPEDRERAREAGFDDHLVKPSSPEVMRCALARARRGG